MEHQILDIGENITISVRISGNLKDEVILLVNGSIFNYRQFDETFLPLLKRLTSANYSFVNYDYVGIGKSSELKGDYDFVELADQQAKLIEKLDLDKVHLFGYSQGSIVSQIMTAKYPKLVKSFGAFGSPNLGDDKSLNETEAEFRSRLESIRSISELYGQKINQDNYKMIYNTVYLPTIFIGKQVEDLGLIEKIINWYIRRKLRPMLTGTPVYTIEQLYSYYIKKISKDEKERYINAMKSIKTPTLLMHGNEDEIVPLSSSQLLAEWIPNAELEIYKGYSHAELLLLKQKARPVVERYAEFLTNLS